MNCDFCDKPVGYFDWAYMIVEDEQIIYAHLDCIAWEELMERAETIDYLTEVLTF